MAKASLVYLWLPLLTGVSLVAAPTISFAAKPPSGSVVVKPADTFTLTGAAGKTIRCAKVKGKYIPGALKSKKYFTPASRALKDLLKTAKKAKGSKRAKLNNKYKSQKAAYQTNAALCSGGPDILKPSIGAMSAADVRYLYDKVAFGKVPPEAITIGTTQGASALVDYLMAYNSNPTLETDAAKWLDESFTTDSTTVTPRGVQLWALYLMLNSQNPFYERLSFLFLHNLLATSMDVLGQESQRPLMVEHFNKIRAHAIDGDYPTLLREIARDSVMLIWLNGDQNTKFQPNENFARELMELFTLSPSDSNGNPNYSETTVAQVARACTGWNIQEVDVGSTSFWTPIFQTGLHDSDPLKVVFEGTGYQGSVENDFDVINHILSRHPNASVYLATRLAKEYFNENPSPQVVSSLASALKSSNYNFKTALAKLLKSTEFYKPENRNTVITSPVERIVSFLRTTNLPYRLTQVELNLESSGQQIGLPPTVFGWKNSEWTNGPWLLSFANTITSIISDSTAFTQAGYTYSNMLPTDPTVDNTIANLSSVLGISLTAEQQASLVTYMTNRYNPTTQVLTPDAWDPANATKVRRKMAGLLEVLSRTTDFQMR